MSIRNLLLTSAQVVLETGKLVHSQDLMFHFNREIQELEQGKTFKYLETEESEGIQHQQMKERLKKEYTRRLRMPRIKLQQLEH
jgi:hypothetical protein